ncbi:MAG: UDP-N-acetylmuramate dehydrogenase [Clostridiales bacterium]|nr:UDP-N-acetylmuramate dehydrogenase [Clostridiales bacterium]
MERLIEFAQKQGIKYLENEIMKNHTTFKIGGAAKLMLFPKNEAQVAAAVKFCRSAGVRYMAIGNGSNLLVSDSGIDAAVIALGSDFSKICLESGCVVFAESGAPLSKLCRFALENSLSGLEFAYGIPGSVGGAVYMNAGAYGGEIKDVLLKINHVDCTGVCGSISASDAALSYRHSVYAENGFVITGAYFKLQKAEKAEIETKMKDLLSRRREKQPLEYPSAGSTFKRPAGHYAARLIEECNLKGMSVGGAAVSEKHAGFVINKGNATAADVLALCRSVSDTVFKEKGVKLEMEVRVVE